MSQVTLTLRQLVENNINIFDFDYELFDNNHKKDLEKLIIDHYYFNEIGFESPKRFKHELKVRMLSILPYYNKLYYSDSLEQRILDNYDVTEMYEKSSTGKDNTSLTSDSNSSLKTSVNNISYESDTPQQAIDISSNDYVSNIKKDIGNNNSSNDNTLNTNSDKLSENVEKYKRTMKGNIGVQTDADAINKYRTTLLKIDYMIISELRDLFLLVY